MASVRAAASKQKLFVVLGMHRSGTSAITRGLQAIGVHLGKNLLPPQGDNPKGFFEDTEIVALNDRLLERAGRVWHSVDPINEDFLTGPACSSLRAEAMSLLDSKFRESDLFGLKDPRLCVLMPFWRCVFEDMDLDVGYVIALRNPLAAAQSLNERDGFLLEKSVALWGLHMLGAVRSTAGQKRVFVSFDALLSEPLEQLSRMANALGLPMPEDTSAEILDYLDAFLEPGLRRQLVSDRELRRSGRATSVVTDLYEGLLQQAFPEPQYQLLNEDLDVEDLLVRFEDLKPLLRALDELHAKVSHASELAAQYEAMSTETSRAREIVQNAHDDACNQRDAIRAEADRLTQEAAVRSNALDQLRAHAANIESHLEIVQKAHDEACVQRDAIRAETDRLTGELAAQGDELDQLRASVSDLESEREGLKGQVQAHRVQIKTLEQLTDETSAALSQMESTLGRSEASLSDARTRIHKFESEVETLNGLLAASERASDARAVQIDTQMESLTMQLARTRALEDQRLALLDERAQLENELHAARARWHAATRETEAERARAETLRTMAQHQAEAARYLHESLTRTQAEAAKYTSSTSWKITAPLRGFSRLLFGGPPPSGAKAARTPAALSAAVWKQSIASIVPTAMLPPPARPPVQRAGRGAAPPQGTAWLAVIIHAFYPELLDEILPRLAASAVQMKLYVTAPDFAVAAVEARLLAQDRPFVLIEADNRGRDIAPFMSGLDWARQDAAPLLLKLHTKRSDHLDGGDRWRKHLLDSLLRRGAPEEALAAFAKDSGLGILAPDGHVLSVSEFIGSNGDVVTRLSQRLGIDQSAALSSAFVAGSMFYALPDVFYGLNTAAISANDFDVERGQIDGTLAHGIERMIGALAAQRGLKLETIAQPGTVPVALGQGAYQFV